MVAAGEFVVSVVDRPGSSRPIQRSLTASRSRSARQCCARRPPRSTVFDVLEGVTDAERFEVAYDPLYGFPTAGRIDNDVSMTDDEFEFRLSDLQVA
jgi:Family of unknown function (DUF6174)